MAKDNESSFLSRFFGFFSSIFEQFKSWLSRLRRPKRPSTSQASPISTSTSELTSVSAPNLAAQKLFLEAAIDKLEALRKQELSMSQIEEIDTQLNSARGVLTFPGATQSTFTAAIETTENLTNKIKSDLNADLKKRAKRAEDDLRKLVTEMSPYKTSQKLEESTRAAILAILEQTENFFQIASPSSTPPSSYLTFFNLLDELRKKAESELQKKNESAVTQASPTPETPKLSEAQKSAITEKISLITQKINTFLGSSVSTGIITPDEKKLITDKLILLNKTKEQHLENGDKAKELEALTEELNTWLTEASKKDREYQENIDKKNKRTENTVNDLKKNIDTLSALNTFENRQLLKTPNRSSREISTLIVNDIAAAEVIINRTKGIKKTLYTLESELVEHNTKICQHISDFQAAIAKQNASSNQPPAATITPPPLSPPGGAPLESDPPPPYTPPSGEAAPLEPLPPPPHAPPASESPRSPDPMTPEERINKWRENFKKYPIPKNTADEMLLHMEEALNMLYQNDLPNRDFLNKMLNAVEDKLQSNASSNDLLFDYNLLVSNISATRELRKKSTRQGP